MVRLVLDKGLIPGIEIYRTSTVYGMVRSPFLGSVQKLSHFLNYV